MNSSKKKILLFFQKVFFSNRIVSYFEKKFISNKKNSNPPIFIIGLPRSGTTLLYQFLIDSCRLAYFNNISNLFFTSPVIVSYVSLKMSGYYKPNSYSSKYGIASGIFAPSESGFIFRSWFKTENKVNEKILKKSISAVSHIFNAPFISKNLYNNYRVETLNKVFPNAIFIEVRRELSFIGQSLLLARKNTTGDFKGWFGLKPLDYEKIIKIEDPIEQVSNQIRSIERTINNSMNNIENSRKIVVSYEELCKNQNLILDRLMYFFEDNDIQIVKNKNRKIKLKKSDSIKLDQKDWNKLCKRLEKCIR